MKKIEGCLLISSLLETIAFYNGDWEFNYGNKIDTIINGVVLNHIFNYQYQLMGGINNIELGKFKSSDDTILIIATAEAVINGGGEQNYINSYLKYFDLLKEDKRYSGQAVLSSLEKIRIRKSIKAIEYSSSHGGNGCAIRTAPIGLKYYKDINKLCEEALIASLVTHHYPIGYLSGIIAALFTAYAVQDINPFTWSIKLIDLYKDNFFHKLIAKYIDFNEKEINEYFIYWEKYNEQRLSKMKIRILPIFSDPRKKIEDLLNYTTIKYITKKKGFENLGGSGLEAVIIAYDNLLLSAIPKNLKVDIENPTFNWETLIYNNVFFFGDNDSVSAISGAWFGALNGIDKFPLEKFKELEFYKEIKDIINKLNI